MSMHNHAMGVLDDQSIKLTSEQSYRLLVLFRWVSLIPPLIVTVLAIVQQTRGIAMGVTFAFALLLTLFITLFPIHLNETLRRNPWLLFPELVFMAALIAFSGGWQTPYYLHALAPLMAAALFFQVRGALLNTSLFLPLYAIAIYISFQLGHSDRPAWLVVVVAVIGFYLLSTVFGYVSALLIQLRGVSQRLHVANRDLTAAHGFVVSLSQAADVEAVQEVVLDTVIDFMGYSQAAIGTVSDDGLVVTDWLRRQRSASRVPTVAMLPIPLNESNHKNLIAMTLQQRVTCTHTLSEVTEPQHWLAQAFSESSSVIAVPIVWGGQPLAVLVVSDSGTSLDQGPREDIRMLSALAQQTAISMGVMKARLRRAKDSAVQAERVRIARDIHDSVSQSLFGISYVLDACLKLLPTHPELVHEELKRAVDAADAVRLELRQTINDLWPDELTSAQFEGDLRRYATDMLQPVGLDISFDVRGDFSTLSSPVLRSLYRISQESLTNVVHHAAATQAKICLDVFDNHVQLAVRDDGRGFEPAVALTQTHGEEHFGLRGIQERVHRLGGTCDIFSRPGAGTSILIELPINSSI